MNVLFANQEILPDFSTAHDLPRAYPVKYSLISVGIYVCIFALLATFIYFYFALKALDQRDAEATARITSAKQQAANATNELSNLYAQEEKSYQLQDWLIIHPALQPLVVSSLEAIDPEVVITSLQLTRDENQPQYKLSLVMQGPKPNINKTCSQIDAAITHTGWFEDSYNVDFSKETVTVRWNIRKTNMPNLSVKPTHHINP